MARHRWSLGAESVCTCGTRRAWVEGRWAYWTAAGDELAREPKCSRVEQRPRRQLDLFAGKKS